MENKKKKNSFTIDIKTAFEIDKQIRTGLAENNLIPEEESRDIRSPKIDSGKYEVKLELDTSTAAALSQLLREGIISANSAHQSNNESVAAAVGKLAKKG